MTKPSPSAAKPVNYIDNMNGVYSAVLIASFERTSLYVEELEFSYVPANAAVLNASKPVSSAVIAHFTSNFSSAILVYVKPEKKEDFQAVAGVNANAVAI